MQQGKLTRKESGNFHIQSREKMSWLITNFDDMFAEMKLAGVIAISDRNHPDFVFLLENYLQLALTQLEKKHVSRTALKEINTMEAELYPPNENTQP